MKAKAQRKHQSNWRNIRIQTEEGIINFELDENGKLKDKMARQTARDLTVEIKKLSSQPDLSQSSLGQDQNMTTLVQPSFPLPPPYYQNVNFVYLVKNVTPSLNANCEASLNIPSSTNQVSSNSVLPDEEQESSQIDESSFFLDDYPAIEGISNDFNMLVPSDDNNEFLFDDNIFYNFDDQDQFYSQ